MTKSFEPDPLTPSRSNLADATPAPTSNCIGMVSGLTSPAKAWYISKHCRQFPRIVVICKDIITARTLRADLSFFLGNHRSIKHFRAWESLPFDQVSPDPDISGERLSILDSLCRQEPAIVVCPVTALLQTVVSPSYLTKLSQKLACGMEVSMEQLKLRLFDSGFRRVTLVEEVGDMSVRGGTIDLFPANFPGPIRIEFVGSAIESLRLFDTESQRSTATLNEFTVCPIREFSPLSQDFESAEKLVRARAVQLEVPPREVQSILDALSGQIDYPGIEAIAPVFSERVGLGEYFDSGTLLVLDQSSDLENCANIFWDSIIERHDRYVEEQRLVPYVEQAYRQPSYITELCQRHRTLFLNPLDLNGQKTGCEVHHLKSFSNTAISKNVKSKAGLGRALDPLVKEIKKWWKEHYNVGFVVGSQQRADRLCAILKDYEIAPTKYSKSCFDWLDDQNAPQTVILVGNISEGVCIPEAGLVLIAESEIFSDRSHSRRSRASKPLQKLLGALAKLKEGDFVVHIDFGIGRYDGLKHIEIEGVGYDFLQIEYANNTKLYLPIENIGRIQKFVCEEGKAPHLDKLGSTRWMRAKAKVRSSVIALAGDLIKLYAARNAVDGWRFDQYGAEDERFADGFGFDETADQMAAIVATLEDMAESKPMDRLVCGDAGFGKTEVALRAAYKCIQHARQVAVLVPTTILVEQHYHVFKERFLGYPVKIAALSRLHSKKANDETLRGLQSGDVDIVIGTHRLLQPDITFKDLGLLIVDEEHRFGVKHKERLKQARRNVDVLTLTATPIPRTLHMALLGIRDVSIISTPPTDRKVIRTFVSQYDENLVRDAILREVQRGGQVFLLHNKVMDIATTTEKFARLVPEARFIFAHGQMKGSELEKRMLSFLTKEYDVLLSTTIIESGLDIPNANTIIVLRADRFGLAQLYQIRGRVGRSNVQAYAYLLVPEPGKLSSEARQRLQALQSLDDLGLGFNLATRDLEIRGAGNLLGKDQSGNVQSVGLDLYNRILKEAVLNLRGQEVDLSEITDPELKLGINAFIPEHYIPDVSERLIIYQRLANLEDSLATDDLASEISDRFGHYSIEVDNLIEVMRFRSLLRKFGVIQADLAGTRLSLILSPRSPISKPLLRELCRTAPGDYRFTNDRNIIMQVDIGDPPKPAKLYKQTERLFNKISL